MKEKYSVLIPENLAIKKPDKKLLELINRKEFNDKVLYKKNSSFHKISVIENEVGRFLHFKNTYQAGFINTPFYKGNLPYINYFLIPYLMNKNIKKILLIGLGTGKLVKDYSSLFDNLEKIDVVDIEENILEIAQSYFDFEPPESFNFYLQDGRIFLRQTKTKYDLIVVDVANNDGIDERFLSSEYLNEIKKVLKKDGIFVSNLCSSAEFENPKNTFLTSTIEKYENVFKNNQIYKGNYSDKVYYKAFFDIEERVIDVTNVIIISSDKYSSNNIKTPLNKVDFNKFESLKVNIYCYLNDLYSNEINKK